MAKRDKKVGKQVDPPSGPSPRRGAAPSDERRPRARVFTPSNPDGKLSMSFAETDIGGPWCFTKATPEHWGSILDFVRRIERMTPEEAFQTGYPGVRYDVDKIPNAEARRRLVDINLDDQDRIWRFQLTGTQRLFGFRAGLRFYALWWDPLHEIWPPNR